MTINNGLVKVTGGKTLEGHATVQGSKNIALHLYAAAMLTDVPVRLVGSPDIVDTDVCAGILNQAGCEASFDQGCFSVPPAASIRPTISRELGARVRTTAVLAAALLTRAEQVTFPYPGGDAFCRRLIDRHLAAMQAAGAEVVTDDTTIRAVCGPRGVRPFTVDVGTPYGPSLGATVTALLLAARAPGTSLITQPSIEPEVTETVRFLTARGVIVERDEMGVHVTGSDWIAGGDFAVAPDRIEAATIIMATAATGGSVHLDGVRPADLPDGLTAVLADAGIAIASSPHGDLTTAVPQRGLRPLEAATRPHPGLPTDTAPQLTAMLTQATGNSLITECVYPRRDTHVTPLQAFGAEVSTQGSAVRIEGPGRLKAADVEAADIRAVTALVIAALAADGTSTVRGLHHLRRGYGRLLDTLATLGADITIEEGEA